MLTLHAPIEPLRRSIFLALGLLGACGGGEGGDSSGAQTTGTTTQAPSTGTVPTSSGSTDEPTSGDTAGTVSATGSGTSGTSGSGTSGTSGTSGETTGVGTTTSDTAVSVGTGETTSGQTDTGDTTSGSSETGEEPDCAPLLQGFTDMTVPSGWVECPGKLPHRVSAEACVVPTTPSNCQLDDQPCKTAADCVEQPFGSCQQFSVQFLGCGCSYGCETDADCEAGSVCRCAGDVLGPVTRCVPSACTDDEDCGGEVCQFSHSEGYDCLDEVVNGACTTPDDVCDTDPPCVDLPCAFDGEAWACSLVACGRPFVVADEAVTAPSTARADWCALVSVARAPEALREALARHWTEIAGYEHASVASFARFVLQLLSVGAGPELVLAAQQALADEVEHARLCYALASQYAGAAVGPGPLPQASTPGASDRAEIVEAVIREACVGETLSALEAREAAAQAVDPGLRRVLTKIADDEMRHAELGWRFVRWALTDADTDTLQAAQDAFTAAIAGARMQAGRLAQEPGTSALRAHGVIDAPLRAAVWQRGLAGLVMPAAAALAA